MSDSLFSALPFAQGFTWGAVTAAYQIEGAWNEAGKGPSIWDAFVRQPGRIERGETVYGRPVDGLLARHITPFVMLYHWDVLLALQDRGSWGERDTARQSADYARWSLNG